MSRIRTNTFALGTSFFVTAFFSFLQVKIITNFLDQNSVGVWAAVIAVGAVLGSFSEVGLPWVLVRYGAKYDAEGRLIRLGKLWRFAFAVYFPGLLAVVGILVLGGPGIASFLGQGEIDRWLLILGYITVASGSLRAFNNSSFRGLRRMVAVAAIEIAFGATVTIALFLLRSDLSVSRILQISLASGLIWAGVGITHLTRIFSRIKAASSAEHLEAPVVPEIKGFWRGAAATGIFLVAIEQLDKPLLASLVAWEQLAVFHVTARLALFARRLISVPFQVMNPEVTHKWESQRREELRKDMELFSKLALGLGLGLVVFLSVFAKPLILLASSESFLSGAPVLWMFTAVLPLACLHQPMVMFLRATGKVWFSFAGDATWLFTYLGLGALLVGRYGLPGFVFGQVVASVILLVYTLAIFHHLEFPRPPLGFFIKRVLLSAGVWFLSVAGGRVLPVWPWWHYVFLGLILGAVANFLIIRGRFLTSDEEKRALDMFAGRGALGKLLGFLISWPHPGANRTPPSGNGG